jgi:CheY-like chemotaxis protein
VILLDMMLPTLDGKAVVETLYHTEQNGRIPISAMSAGQFRADAASSGVTAFLSKPFDVQDLLGLLNETLKPTC